MEKIDFKDYPDLTTPIDSKMMKQLQKNIENGITEAISDSIVESLEGNETDKTPNVASIKKEFSAIKGKVLWSNSNPNDSFESQNVTLDNSDYDLLEFFYYDFVSTKSVCSQRVPKGNNAQLFALFDFNNLSYAGYRKVTRVSDTDFEVGEAITCIFDNQLKRQKNNQWLIPLYIVGYKTNLFNEEDKI